MSKLLFTLLHSVCKKCCDTCELMKKMCWDQGSDSQAKEEEGDHHLDLLPGFEEICCMNSQLPNRQCKELCLPELSASYDPTLSLSLKFCLWDVMVFGHCPMQVISVILPFVLSLSYLFFMFSFLFHTLKIYRTGEMVQ